MTQIEDRSMTRERMVRLLSCMLVLVVSADATPRFTGSGPVLTVTLKDPQSPSGSASTTGVKSMMTKRWYELTSSSSPTVEPPQPLLQGESSGSSSSSSTSILADPGSVSSLLSPTLTYSVQSKIQPFPEKIPFLHFVSTKIGYRYNSRGYHSFQQEGAADYDEYPSDVTPATAVSRKTAKRWSFSKRQKSSKEPHQHHEILAEGMVRFASRKYKAQLELQPMYQPNNGPSLIVRAGNTNNNDDTNTSHAKHGWHAMARMALSGHPKRVLEWVQASYQIRKLPFASVESLTLIPSHDFTSALTSCIVSAETKSGKTCAILDLNSDDPTLSVVHALDDRNVIAPEISLQSAKITYHWDMKLEGGGSIRTRVDPASTIHVTWTDAQSKGTGTWVTDIKLPLTAQMGPLAADIRVRRQFQF